MRVWCEEVYRHRIAETTKVYCRYLGIQYEAVLCNLRKLQMNAQGGDTNCQVINYPRGGTTQFLQSSEIMDQ